MWPVSGVEVGEGLFYESRQRVVDRIGLTSYQSNLVIPHFRQPVIAQFAQRWPNKAQRKRRDGKIGQHGCLLPTGVLAGVSYTVRYVGLVQGFHCHPTPDA